MQNPTRRCAVVNDFTGFGRCSICVALPILSSMGIQCCSVPTAILSNHTGYSSYFFDSYTDKMADYINEWEKLGLEFDTVFSGFLGCEKQIDIVCDFIRDFAKKDAIVLVDPVMGDNGKIYTTYTREMCEKMKELTLAADIITPNITEACILTDTEYVSEEITDDCALDLLSKLSLEGKRSVVLTGIISGGEIKTAVFDNKTGGTAIISNPRTNISYPGTGDLFASVLCGAVTGGASLFDAARLSADFVEKASAFTSQFKTNINDGIAFEPFLKELIK